MDHLPTNLIWSVFKNVTSQMGGRLLLTVIRFGIAVLIARYLGVERFGEYSLILAILLIAEWVTDFGLTEIVVRAICQQPDRQVTLLRALAAAKLIQVVVGFAFLVGVLIVMGYPAHVVRAGVIAGMELPFYGGVLVYRTFFQARLLMERDVGAEILGMLVMIPLLWIACVRDAGLEVLIACYVSSRIVFLVAAWLMGRFGCSVSPVGASAADAGWLIKAALPLGVAGLLVALYNAMDLILLSKLADVRSVGLFSGALRFVWPALIAVQAIGATAFPLLSSYWGHRPRQLQRTLQRALNMVVLIGAGAWCLFQVCPRGLMGLLGPEMAEAAGVLQLLSWSILARVVSKIMGPLVVVTGRQHHALWLTGFPVVVKAALLAWLIPRFGAIGAATAWVLSDFIALVPTLLLTQHLVGFRVSWRVALRVAVAAAVTIGVIALSGIADTVTGFVVAAGLFPALAVVLRAVPLGELRRLVDGIREQFSPGKEPAE